MAIPTHLLITLLATLSIHLASTETSIRSNNVPTPAPYTTPIFAPSTPTPPTTASPELTTAKPRRRNRRCKCLKRVTKEVNQMIDRRLEEFENRYLLHLNDRSGVMSPKTSFSRLEVMDRRLYQLSGEMTHAKEAVNLMKANLRTLRQDLGHVQGDVRGLNVSLKQLDAAVQNVSRLVRSVEGVMPSSPGCPGGGSGENCLQGVQIRVKTYPKHCDEVYQKGGMQFKGDYYIMIKPDGVTQPFKVLCKIFNNSGWTVIQRRQDGSVDFFRDWQEYKKGFGSLEGEFWLGNDYIHYLTEQEPTMLRIELTDWEGRHYQANYDSFRVENEKGLYRLHVDRYQGDAGDSLRSHWENHDGMPFSTKDRDNDGRYYDSCAEHFHGAWWFNNCFDSHLNGKYYHKGFHKNYFQRDGIQWNTIHMYSSLRAVHMMLKPAPAASVVLPGVEGKTVTQNGGGRKDKSRSKRKGRSRKERQRA